jgi:hypothetical protein
MEFIPFVSFVDILRDFEIIPDNAINWDMKIRKLFIPDNAINWDLKI